jgi:uncharacterized membrane protein
MVTNIDEMRLDYVTRRKGNWAVPTAGMIAYSLAAILSLILEPRWHNLALVLCFWTIPPVGALLMKIRGEERGSPQENSLFDLSTKARWMALSTWAIHIPIWIYAPTLLPITIGIGFALHWVIFSWIVNHPVGFIHLGMRIVLVLSAWHLFPDNRMGAVAAGIAIAYAISVFQLSRIDWKARLAPA